MPDTRRALAAAGALAAMLATTSCVPRDNGYGGRTKPEPVPNADHPPVGGAGRRCDDGTPLAPGNTCILLDVTITDDDSRPAAAPIRANVVAIDASGETTASRRDYRSLPDIVPVARYHLAVEYPVTTVHMTIVLLTALEHGDYLAWQIYDQRGREVPHGQGHVDNSDHAPRLVTRTIELIPPGAP